MATWVKVILKDFVPGLGDQDEVVRVRRGYAFNYLIPKGLAILGTPSTLKDHEEKVKQRRHKEEQERQAILELARQIEEKELKIPVIVGEDGRLFGSITTAQLAKALEAEGISVDRRKITLLQEVKRVGKYKATIALYKDIKATLNFEVVPKEEEK